MKKYFKAIMKMGHCGRGNYQEIPLYIYAKNIIEAIKIAKRTPAIKHSQSPISVKEITEEEFKQGRAEDPYKNRIKDALKDYSDDTKTL